MARELAPTPPMGFNTWNCFGMDIDQELALELIAALVDGGFAEVGYQSFNLDDGWMADRRDEQGRLRGDRNRFPMEIAGLAERVHRAGLRFGIYSDCGTQTCGGLPASYGHERVDAETFASWGVDYLKHDWCHVPLEEFPDRSERQVAEELYGRMAEGIASAGRPIVLSVCCWGHGDPWEWAGKVGQLWRTTPDIEDRFNGASDNGLLSMVQIFHRNVVLDGYGGSGGWNDPDMLEVGNGGMTTVEYRSHFALWCLMAAPLLIGTDLRSISEADAAILKNTDLIALDQDPLGRQGRLEASEGDLHLLVKDLEGGDVAVGVFNEGEQSGSLDIDWVSLAGERAGGATVRNLWDGDVAPASPTFGVRVEAHDTGVWRLETGR